MSAQHIRGPWVSQTDSGRAMSSVWTANGDIQIAVCKSRGLALAGNRANARLIAAAPELLELCVRFEGWLTETEAGQRARAERTYDSKGLEDLRAAITKATGGAT